jgi:hypothetical protein
MAETIHLKFGHATVRVGHFATLNCLWSVFFRTWNCWPFSASVPPGWLSGEKTRSLVSFGSSRGRLGGGVPIAQRPLWPRRAAGNYVGGTASATVGVCVGAEGSRPVCLRLPLKRFPATANSGRAWVVSHVWMAPGLQGLSMGGTDKVACGHVSGLLARRDGRWPRWNPRPET